MVYAIVFLGLLFAGAYWMRRKGQQKPGEQWDLIASRPIANGEVRLIKSQQTWIVHIVPSREGHDATIFRYKAEGKARKVYGRIL